MSVILRNTLDYMIVAIIFSFSLHLTLGYMGIYLGKDGLDSIVLTATPFLPIYVGLSFSAPAFIRKVYRSVYSINKKKVITMLDRLVNVLITTVYTAVVIALTAFVTLHFILTLVTPYYRTVTKIIDSSILPFTEVTVMTITLVTMWVLCLLIMLASNNFIGKEILIKKKSKPKN